MVLFSKIRQIYTGTDKRFKNWLFRKESALGRFLLRARNHFIRYTGIYLSFQGLVLIIAAFYAKSGSVLSVVLATSAVFVVFLSFIIDYNPRGE